MSKLTQKFATVGYPLRVFVTCLTSASSHYIYRSSPSFFCCVTLCLFRVAIFSCSLSSCRCFPQPQLFWIEEHLTHFYACFILLLFKTLHITRCDLRGTSDWSIVEISTVHVLWFYYSNWIVIQWFFNASLGLFYTICQIIDYANHLFNIVTRHGLSQNRIFGYIELSFPCYIDWLILTAYNPCPRVILRQEVRGFAFIVHLYLHFLRSCFSCDTFGLVSLLNNINFRGLFKAKTTLEVSSGTISPKVRVIRMFIPFLRVLVRKRT